MPIKGYTTIALPNKLVDEVDRIVKDKVLGYTTRPDFIKEAVRKLIIEVKSFKDKK